MVMIRNSPSHRQGLKVQLVFQITQHIRDEQLVNSLVQYLGCGKVYNNKEKVDFKVFKFSDLNEKVIPLFQKYPIQGVKLLDYLDFVKVLELMKNKVNLTDEGLDQIRKIKAGMNRGRKILG